MKAGMKALNFNLAPIDRGPRRLDAPARAEDRGLRGLIIQHCKLLQGGQEVKMSKRAASYVTLRELMEEVGVDATRFFFVMRKTNSHLDFDMDVAKKKSLENPGLLRQYAHARICSIYRQEDRGGKVRRPT
jgi:arginyl-tRNA synthetase